MKHIITLLGSIYGLLTRGEEPEDWEKEAEIPRALIPGKDLLPMAIRLRVFSRALLKDLVEEPDEEELN